jgi:hypothetical protein
MVGWLLVGWLVKIDGWLVVGLTNQPTNDNLGWVGWVGWVGWLVGWLRRYNQPGLVGLVGCLFGWLVVRASGVGGSLTN